MTTTREQLRAAILQPRPMPFRDVEVGIWKTPENPNGMVRIVGMTGAERDHWEALRSPIVNGQIKADRENQRANMLAKCLHDPVSGERLFKDEEAMLLGNVAAEILDPLFLVAAELSGVGATLEKLKGNS